MFLDVFYRVAYGLYVLGFLFGYVEVELALDQDEVPYGSSGRLRIEAEATPLGVLGLRRLLLFVARL